MAHVLHGFAAQGFHQRVAEALQALHRHDAPAVQIGTFGVRGAAGRGFCFFLII